MSLTRCMCSIFDRLVAPTVGYEDLTSRCLSSEAKLEPNMLAPLLHGSQRENALYISQRSVDQADAQSKKETLHVHM